MGVVERRSRQLDAAVLRIAQFLQANETLFTSFLERVSSAPKTSNAEAALQFNERAFVAAEDVEAMALLIEKIHKHYVARRERHERVVVDAFVFVSQLFPNIDPLDL